MCVCYVQKKNFLSRSVAHSEVLRQEPSSRTRFSVLVHSVEFDAVSMCVDCTTATPAPVRDAAIEVRVPDAD